MRNSMKVGAIMKLKSARLKNMKPIFRGSGQKEIFIDFTKSTHKIVFIIGPNGSGKSTIMNALQPLPESPSLFLEKEEGLKELEYYFEDIIYKIRIAYPVSSTGTRLQTKAFLYKICSDGEEVDLNPNGNIGSYKDALYTEFKLDPNFVSLSKLSQDDKGLVSKTPSERKKFVNDILNDVQIYNDINKTLQKRSSIFKSMINSITAKINTVGDRIELQHRLTGIKLNIETLEADIEKYTREVSDNRSMIQLLDPNGSIQNEFNLLCSEKTRLEQEIKYAKIPLSRFLKKYPTKDSVKVEKEAIEKELVSQTIKLDTLSEQLNVYFISREEETKTLQIKQQHLNALQSEFTVTDIVNEINRLKDEISGYENIFHKIGDIDISISKDEYILGLNTLKDIKDMIINMRSFATYMNIKKSIEIYLNGNNVTDIKQEIENRVANKEEELRKINEQLAYCNGLLEKTQILENRPTGCNIDDCPFIRNAVLASKELESNNIESLQKQKWETEEVLNSFIKEREDVYNLIDTFQSISNIARYIINNQSILKKLPNGSFYSNLGLLFQKISDGYNFNDINTLYSYIEYSNIFDLYRLAKERLTKMEYEYKLYENKIASIEEIDKDIKKIQDKVNDIVAVITKYQSEMSQLSASINSKQNTVKDLTSLDEMYSKLEQLESRYKEVEDCIQKSIVNISQIQHNLELMNIATNHLNAAKNNIKPLKDEESKINYSLTKLDEYEAELMEYRKKFDMTELIKKYSSPTKGGIQTVFMKLYMSKTLSIANEMLSHFFQGDLYLLPYIINESEFRIPCKNQNSTVLNDDISSCSGAERSMISMILSFALLRQSSTKYNIPELDEVDETLDENNRAMFPVVLDMITEEMGVEQCLVISHSSEFDMSNADIILTMNNDNYKYDNVIFSYSN